MKKIIQETHASMGEEWWNFDPTPEDAERPTNPVFLASIIKRASADLFPHLSEMRVHHLIACVLRRSGFPAHAVLGRERATDIISPAYRSWVEIEGSGVVTTASAVDLLCDELVRLPYENSVSEWMFP